MSLPAPQPSPEPPTHTLRNAVILGAFIFSVIVYALEALGLLPQVNGVVLIVVTLAVYGVLVGVAVTVRYAVTGKNVHQ